MSGFKPPQIPDNPVVTHPNMQQHVEAIAAGGERLVAKVSQDINEISIIRAMQIGYMMACEDNGLGVPDMPDPAVARGYGGV